MGRRAAECLEEKQRTESTESNIESLWMEDIYSRSYDLFYRVCIPMQSADIPRRSGQLLFWKQTLGRQYDRSVLVCWWAPPLYFTERAEYTFIVSFCYFPIKFDGFQNLFYYHTFMASGMHNSTTDNTWLDALSNC